MKVRKRLVAVFIVSASLALAACEEQTFEDPISNELEIIDLDRREILGQEKIVTDVIQVTGEMVHPEIIGRWSNLVREIEVEVYILRKKDFDAKGPNAHPSDYENILWSSVPEGGVGFGDIPTTLHVHPCVLQDPEVPDGPCVPDQWVVFFFNPKDPGRANKGELSGRVWLRWFE